MSRKHFIESEKQMTYLWTSEAVSAGHPDKVADQIADAILDAHLAKDPFARVACEVTLTTNFVLLTGEITSIHSFDELEYQRLVRQVLCEIGYDRPASSFDGNTVEILNKIKGQSPEISEAVTRTDGEIGAGDQGIMFGFACVESPVLTPLTHWLSFEVVRLLEENIQQGRQQDRWLSPFLPDAKSQVTVLYEENGTPLAVDTVLISVCHARHISLPELRQCVEQIVCSRLMNEPLFHQTKWLINPAGEWHIGGPAADTGLSGRKIVVDNYGADCQVGGGSFSGKDPTKVDRSAAYAARHVAKNIVAANLATKCQLQLSYAIGVVEPISIRVQTFGMFNRQIVTGDAALSVMVAQLVSFTPKAIIERFGLRKPIYRTTASGGHFGRPSFPWEQLDLVEQFLDYFGVSNRVPPLKTV